MKELFPKHKTHFKIYGKVALTGEPAYFENSSEITNRWYKVHTFRWGDPEERKVAILFRSPGDNSSTLLSAIVNGSDDAIISKDLNSIITSWNPGAESLFGYTAQEAIGQSVVMLFPPDRIHEEDKLLSQLRRGERIEHYETIRLHKDGTPLNISLTISPVKDSTGKIIGASKIARDITSQKKVEKKLQEMNEALEDRTKALLSYQEQLRVLVSRLSKAEEYERLRLATELHDNLGQTLTIGKMKIDQLKKKSAEGQPVHDFNELEELINESIRYTRELMLDLKPPPSLNKGDLKETIEWVADKMEKYNLKVTISADNQPKPLDEDVLTTVRQCIRELLFNVVKHAKVNETHISITRQKEQVQITIEDKGVGFSPEDEKLVPNKEKGFGLFSILERINLLGGTFEINSEPGEGTKATLLAPVKDTQSEIQAAPPAAHPGPSDFPQGDQAPKSGLEKKIRVLLADDHQMMREGLKKIIQEENDLTVIAEASNGQEAIRLARETSPDIIVMDVNMPGMNGIEATRKISADNRRVRIIGLSLHDSRNVDDSMKNAGATAYLTKTEATEALCATIRSEYMILKRKEN